MSASLSTFDLPFISRVNLKRKKNVVPHINTPITITAPVYSIKSKLRWVFSRLCNIWKLKIATAWIELKILNGSLEVSNSKPIIWFECVLIAPSLNPQANVKRNVTQLYWLVAICQNETPQAKMIVNTFTIVPTRDPSLSTTYPIAIPPTISPIPSMERA